MTIALSADFLAAYSNVQKGQQKQVREFIERFQSQPDAPGLNYEAVQGSRSKDLYSVRINKAYRAIVFHPAGSPVYVLSWVDHHDEAYRWAERRSLAVNPATGSLQVIPVGESEDADRGGSAEDKPAGLFDAVKDKHLIRLGVPEELLALVRGIETEEEFDKVEDQFPAEAQEALYMLAAGYELEEVFRELEKVDEERPVDKEDFVAALQSDDSRRRFYVIDEAQNLSEILDAPLEQWRVFLHPKQRRLVKMRANGPVRVLGGAGTGKTVVAMHRARHLANALSPGGSDQILFTTFTKNLATDIQDNLRKICPAELLSRIEVVNLDAWVANFLRARGYRHQIVYDDEENDAWSAALNLSPGDVGLNPGFYRSEWEQVIQAQDITSADQYLRASRLGRGTRLDRRTRQRIWPVFEEYRAQLNEEGKKEYIDLLRDARRLIEEQGLKLPYRSIVVDEAQDMSPEAFRLLRAMVPDGADDLFIVGDAHQRIYRHKTSLGQCGIDIRGRGRKLKINYRTTDEIRRFAVGLLEGRKIDDLDGGIDDQKGYVSLTHGAPPDVHVFASMPDELEFLRSHVDRLHKQGVPLESICLVARTHRILDSYVAALNDSEIATYEIRRNAADRRDRPGLRVATIHRVKGLEFEHMVVVSANAGILPLDQSVGDAEDAVASRNLETGERSLLYVALTRAKRSATVTAWGVVSPFIAPAVR